jgi:anti-anti-sigma regulatory factor
LTADVFDPKSQSGPPAPTGDDLPSRAVVEPAGEQHNLSAPLKITGDLTIAAATAQHAAFAGFIGQGSGVALDLSGVPACDTAGLQLIHSLGKSLAQRKGHLQIVAVSLEFQELATALGLHIHDLNDFRAAGAVDAGSRSRSTDGGL